MFWQPVLRQMARNSYKSCVSVSSSLSFSFFKIHGLLENILWREGNNYLTDLQWRKQCLKLKQ